MTWRDVLPILRKEYSYYCALPNNLLLMIYILPFHLNRVVAGTTSLAGMSMIPGHLPFMNFPLAHPVHVQNVSCYPANSRVFVNARARSACGLCANMSTCRAAVTPHADRDSRPLGHCCVSRHCCYLAFHHSCLLCHSRDTCITDSCGSRFPRHWQVCFISYTRPSWPGQIGFFLYRSWSERFKWNNCQLLRNAW